MQTNRAVTRSDRVTKQYHNVPIIYNTVVPSIMPKGYAQIFLSNVRTVYATINAQGIYPIIYPPVGPTITESPPTKPENTGSPTTPIATNTLTATLPMQVPSNTAQIYTANDESDSGIGPIGTVIGEHIHRNPAISAV